MSNFLQLLFLISITLLSCSLFSSDLVEENPSLPSLCPLDTCQKVTIELGMPGYNYSAPFTFYKWKDWGTGLEVSWTDGGMTIFYTFPNHRICHPQFRICKEETANQPDRDCKCNWQEIESCPKNLPDRQAGNTITVTLDSCLWGQTTLFLELFLVDHD